MFCFPEDFIKRLNAIYGYDIAHNILISLSNKKAITFRVNSLKSNVLKIKLFLKNSKIDFQQSMLFNDAFHIVNTTLKKLQESDIYKNGEIYIQNLSSMIPVHVLNPVENTKILDIAAAPGSKTTLIAAMMKNKGEIVANDTSKIRLLRLKANLENQGVDICRVISNPAQIVWKKYPEYFDKVLVDVPCSMEGSFSKEKPTSYSTWSKNKIKILSKQQKWILRSALSCLKPGGELVYSTCTLTPEENEEVIDWILNKEKEKIELINIMNYDKIRCSVLRSWNSKIYANLDATLKILPQGNFEGFYIAKIRKISTTVKYIP